MSFGFSTGDFLAVLRIVNEVRKRFVHAPEQFHAISADTKSLSNVLRDIDDIDPTDTLSDDQKRRLSEISGDCLALLKEILVKLDHYQVIGDKQVGASVSRVWKRLKWDHSEITAFQERIQEQISAFTLFLAALNLNVGIATREIAYQTKETVGHIRQYQLEQQRNEILNWLSNINYASKHTDNLSRREEGTGDWLLKTGEFQGWIDGDQQTLLCKGIPGAGKTVLASIIIDHLLQRVKTQKDNGVAYIYCNFRQQHEQSTVDLIASLLKQLASSSAAIQRIYNLYLQHKKTQTRPRLYEISELLFATVGEYSKTYFVIDAVDECILPDSSRFLFEMFSLQKKRNVNILATSRKLPEILSKFEGRPALEIRAHEDDVKRYLRGRLQAPPSSALKDSDIQDEVVEAIETSVEGIELQHALAVELGQTDLDVDNVVAIDDIISVCSGIVTVDERSGIVRLVHYTAQKFFKRSVQVWFPDAEYQITLICLTYLNFDSFGAGACGTSEEYDRRLYQYPFHVYAAKYWSSYAQSVTLSRIEDPTLRFIDSPAKLDACAQSLLTRKIPETGQSLVHAAINSGNIPVIELLVRSGGSLDSKTSAGETPLMRAVSQPAATLTEALLKLGADPNHRNAKGETALSLASKRGNPLVVKTLLLYGADVEVKNTSGYTALFLAAAAGSCDCVELLASNGGDGNTTDRFGRTPLHAAATAGHIAVAKSLLALSGLQLNAQDIFG
ncbi:hypothetical protein BJY04DRAFT_223608 [Aspergillus karnatakaensis]|uniref:ankyrin repeat domain-containing protein n=1 Tax=Aspergillus karnatakaensis TaxID=1810916 RepID=UPI003CCD9991